jgi:hypothetical protein
MSLLVILVLVTISVIAAGVALKRWRRRGLDARESNNMPTPPSEGPSSQELLAMSSSPRSEADNLLPPDYRW